MKTSSKEEENKMKKIALTLTFIITVITAICLIGPTLGIVISAIFVIGGIKLYSEKDTTAMKILSISLIIIGGISALSNIPGFIGLAAIALAYILYKKLYGEKVTTSISTTNDPFTNFEREWSKLKNN